MSNKTNAAEILDDDNFDELDALISDAQLDEQEPVTIEVSKSEPEESVDDIDMALLEDVSTDLEEADAADATADDTAPIESDKVGSTAKPAKAAAKKSKSSAPRFSTGVSLIEFGEKVFDKDRPLLLTTDDAVASDLGQVNQDNLSAFNAVSAVKVREKLANLMLWAAGQKSLSKYTHATFAALIKKGSMTKAEVRNNLLDLGLSIGTASSQAGQMSHLLQVTKVATFESGKFVLNEDSVLASLMPEEVKSDDNTPAAE